MSHPIGWTASRAVQRLKAGEVSPLELLRIAYDRIAEVEPAVNALPTLCRDRAEAHTRALMAGPYRELPLAGLPIAVKDLTDVAGVRTTYGSRAYAEHVPAASDILVERLEAAGAIVVAKSNTPEFGAGSHTFNEVFGVTRNPWATGLSPGGSSGGAAAALATGEVWLATGTDLGGSLRIPAAYCGVVGLRPTAGVVPHGPAPDGFETLGVAGPMARTVADLALMLDVMAGRDQRDPLSRAHVPGAYQEAIQGGRPPRRVAYSPDLGITPVDPEVALICQVGAARFATLGCDVAAACPDLAEAHATFVTLRGAYYANQIAPQWHASRDLLKPELAANIAYGLRLDANQVGQARRMRTLLRARAVEFFRDWDLLVCPTVVVPPFPVGQRYVEAIGAHRLESYFHWLILTYAISLLDCPALSIPCGFTRDGLPVGLQLIAPPFAEGALLAAAAYYESLTALAATLPIDPRPE
ncbi:MAG: amidase [Alphaproteobacteria bacterium]|nr:amidase [Alphaproteobacteria bacterium]